MEISTSYVERQNLTVLLERLKQQSTLTGLAAVLFASGIVLLFIALYKDASHTGSPVWIVALGVLAATVLCWIAAARRGPEPTAPSAARDVA